MQSRFVMLTCLLLVAAAFPLNALATDYYASPNGTGNGSSAQSPGKIVNLVPLLQAGDTLWLLDGTYTGSDNVIYVYNRADGTAQAPITIKAVNDGAVTINGEGARRPVYLYGVDYWIIEGLDAHNAGPATTSHSVVELYECNYCQIKRFCAWDAGNGNDVVFSAHSGVNNLFEDCAGWGWARKIFSSSYGGNNTTFRRCFARWEACTCLGNKIGFSTVFNNYNSLFENCIATWDTSAGDMPQSFTQVDFDQTPCLRIPTTSTFLTPTGGSVNVASNVYRPQKGTSPLTYGSGTYNGQQLYRDTSDTKLLFIWWSNAMSAWVISQGDTNIAPTESPTAYWYKTTTPDSPTGTYTAGPNTAGDPPVVEWATKTNYATPEALGTFGVEGWYNSTAAIESGMKMKGCIAYLKGGRAGGFPGLIFSSKVNDVEITHCATYVDPDITYLYMESNPIRPVYLMNNQYGTAGSMSLRISNTTTVPDNGLIESEWSQTSLLETTPGTATILLPRDGLGCTIQKRYVDGQLTTTDLWPWPMDSRISAAMQAGGYAAYSVTSEIAELSIFNANCDAQGGESQEAQMDAQVNEALQP